MTNQYSMQFTDKNLQNRSFRGQNLNYADFSGADIRGCDFSLALLQQANFQNVKAGQTPQQFLILFLVAIVFATLSLYAANLLIFGILGRTPEDPAFNYSIALFTSLIVSGVASVARKRWPRIGTILSGTVSAAWLAFFYGGYLTGNNPVVASISAVIGAIAGALICIFFNKEGLINVAVGVVGTISAYGSAFLLFAVAITFLSVNYIIYGCLWGAWSVIGIAMTMASLKITIKDIITYRTTSFCGANLANANFTGAKLGSTDFNGAVGWRKIKSKFGYSVSG
jgi:Pentapeptide repeats (8 copies)